MVSLLPPFINTNYALPAQLAALVLVILCSEFVCMMLYAAGGKSIGKVLPGKPPEQFTCTLCVNEWDQLIGCRALELREEAETRLYNAVRLGSWQFLEEAAWGNAALQTYTFETLCSAGLPTLAKLLAVLNAGISKAFASGNTVPFEICCENIH